MASDSEQAAQILRGLDKRISRLEEDQQPEGPANIIRVDDGDSRLWDDASFSTTETTGTKWGSADWAGSSDVTTDMNWS